MRTYIFVPVFDERVPAWLAFEEPGFVEEEVELGDFAEF